jgi:two-component system sensor histidine kinase MprB
VTFRRRISLLAGGAVAVAIVLASVLAYVTIGAELRGQVERSLTDHADELERGLAMRPKLDDQGAPPPLGAPFPPGEPKVHVVAAPPGGTDFVEQLVRPDGTAIAVGDGGRMPVDETARAVAGGRSGRVLDDVRVDGETLRVLSEPLPGGGALQVGRSLTETDHALDRVRLILIIVALAGVALAALLGRLVAERAIAPLRRLTATAEHVAATRDLDERIGMTGHDEIGRLAQRFDEMLDALSASMGALDASVRSQRQLIADASHELRTPVTSLRTNLEVLQANADLDPERRQAILARATAQAAELTLLMNDVIDLARGDERGAGLEPVRLDELVEEAIERAQRHAPEQGFQVELEETTVVGAPPRLARALNNLLDNAVAWNADGGTPVEVCLRDGTLTIRDRGPGFAPAELGHVFDRFFRGAEARERPGSGLGLAIVRQVAESHRGRAEARNHPDGGAELRLSLPVAAT